MDPSLFDELQHTLSDQGAEATLDQLCTRLRERKDYSSLFYAQLMKRRHQMGASPIPTGPAKDLPESMHAQYEDAIREAARLVGQLFVDEGNLPQAWVYYRLLGETEPMARALEKFQPGESDDVHQLVQIAFYEGVQPRRGFDLILQRFGICNAITTMGGGHEFPHGTEVRDYCISRLVHALHTELCERLRGEIVRQEGSAPPAGTSLPALMAGRDWLFAEEFAHIDMSHLSAVVQMSIQLQPGKELELAQELCAYGRRLPARLQYAGDPPFEDQYRDYDVYLAILQGEHVDEGIKHFKDKAAKADPETIGTSPAEVLVNLLLRINRPGEALAVARQHLLGTNGRRLTCPNLAELCQRARDYGALAEIAREQGDAVHFVAGLLASKSG